MRAVRSTIALLIGLSAHAAQLEAQGTIVVLVRHAERASPSGDPGLTSAGEARAQALADTLQRLRLDGVIVTQYRRTQATAAPAAAARGLVPIVVSTGPTVVAHAESVAAAVRRFPPRSAVLVVGHSNTLGPIIAALGGPAISDLCDAEYATLFLLTIAEEGAPARLLRTTVGAPDPATATACQQLPGSIPPVQGQPRTAFALRYIDLAVGAGQPVRPRQCIYAHYTGWLTSGTKFDSSRDTLPDGAPRPPIAFAQGARRVIAGWDAGFEGMAVGGRRRLLIPYQLAYGELGRPPVIPPRAELIFDVEVMAVADTLARADPAPAQGAAAGPRCPAWADLRSAAPPDSTVVVLLGTGMPRPDPDASGPATAVVVGGRVFLFDAGPGVVRRMAAAGLPITGPTALFLTHLHSDHTLGYPDLIFTSWVMGRRAPLPAYGPRGLRRMTDRIIAAWDEDIRLRTDGLEHGTLGGWRVAVHEISPGLVYDSAGVRVTAIPVLHGNWAAAFGYRIDTPDRSVVISGDTRPSEALAAAARGVDVLVHEVYPETRVAPERRPGGEDWPRYLREYHTSDVELGRLAARAQPRLLILTHLVRMRATDEDLLAGVRAGGFTGRTAIGRDLERY